jgi:hypothetical protein
VKRIFCIIASVIAAHALWAQEEETPIATIVNLEAFEVSAGLEDFDVADFINQVRNDTTFYQAFLNMKYYPHRVESNMQVYDKKDRKAATLRRTAVQKLNNKSQKWVDILSENSTGKLKNRKGEWKYLTAEIYDDVFFSTTPTYVSNKMTSKEQELTNESRMDKHQAQLKKMLFNPGDEIENIPFVGDKMAIFSEEMMPYYTYKIFEYNWADTIPCIVFSCFVIKGEEDEVVIQDLTSYFHRDTHEVIARDYYLAYNTLFFDFDIRMKVENRVIDSQIVPTKVWYNGFWDIPFSKPENITFELSNSDYDLNK